MINTKNSSLIKMKIIGACLLVALVYMFCFYPQTEILQGYSDTRAQISVAKEKIYTGKLPARYQPYPIFF